MRHPQRELFRFKNKKIQGIFTFIILVLLSFLITCITLMFSTATWDLSMPLFRSYFKSPLLLLMNFIPIFLLMAVFYLALNRMWLSFLISSLLFVIMSFVNKSKLTFRDDPFSFIDIKLIRESLEMAERYEIRLSLNMIILVISLVAITILLKFLFNYKIGSKKIRLSLIAVLLVVSIAICKTYFNTEVYNKIGDKSLINIWSQTQQFQSKGFVYPFIYSIKDAHDTKLEGYDEKKAMEVLNKMSYYDITEDRKVNVIGIMLEAYNDFSKFDTVDLGIDVYKNFHDIQKESIHGNLVTNIFAGDTIQTERSFITGYNNHPKYFKETNSFVWYFKEQGYRTEAMHPIYGWFYNRRNINPYLGFDSFDFYENKYKGIREEFFEDYDFFDFILEGYKDSRENNTPYFNFSVTYQNHGPYSDEKYSENQFLLKKPHYDDKLYNIVNNYLAGIKKTDDALKKLVDNLRNVEEPTVVVVFGDHNPWLGKDAACYEMMDINLDLSTADGFENYFETPYIIWGNEAAKQSLNKDFAGEGEDVSPNFLMSELFQCLGWEGNEYMQYLMNVREHFDVINKVNFKENGKYTSVLSRENQQLYEEFLNVEYYQSHSFKKR